MGRRAGLLIAVLALLLVGAVVAFGALSGGLPAATPGEPAASTTTSTEPRSAFALSVDVTSSGTVWLTTAGADCGGCVLVWRRGPHDDEWFPLRQVGSDHRTGQIRTADRGGLAVIGGAGLWVTYDGGDNWRAETDVLVRPGDDVQVEVSTADAWALVRGPEREPALWRFAMADPGWRKASLPPRPDPDASPVAVGDALLLWVERDGVPAPVATYDGGRTWQPFELPCTASRVGTVAAYTTCASRRGLELAVRVGGAWETWPLAGALGPARNLSPVAAADSVATTADGTGYAVVRGNLLVTHDRGRGGWSRVE